ncbi:MAG: hypothetical protein NTV08_08315 [Verrucomicrobia bacterium]|nr:hypothetical protein [Verrucomicrobiota bacterium]
MKISRLLPLIAIFATTSALLAQGPDKGRAQSEELMERARCAKAEGRGEETEDIMRKLKHLEGELREGARKKGEPRKSDAVHREIEELRKAGKHDEAERLAQKFSSGGPGAPHAEAQEKLQHIVEAIGHLCAAGLNEPAAALENVDREIKEQLGRHGALPEPGGKPHPAAPADGDVRVQMQKLAHAVEELRAQVQALRGEGGKKKEFSPENPGKGGKGTKFEKKGGGDAAPEKGEKK